MKTFFPNLDGLRFLAFMSVFVSHGALFFGYQNDSFFWQEFKKLFLVNGDLGVIFFFVLSGFLLTYLFLEEKKNTGTLNLKKFYKKRIVRIWPVYFLTIILGFFIIPIITKIVGGDFPFTTDFNFSSLPWYIFFVSNIHMTFLGAPNLFVAILWFISAQEQFYLIWPFLFKWFSKNGILISIFCIILGSFIFRLFFAYNYNIIHYFTISVIGDIAVGALLAYTVEFLPNIKDKFINLSRRKVILLYTFIFVLVPLKGVLIDLVIDGWYRWISAFLPLLFAVLFAFVILQQIYSKYSLPPLFTKLGKISYGLYCYHLVALFSIFVILHFFKISSSYMNFSFYIFVLISTLLLTILYAHLSHKYIEKKFIHLKNKFSF